LREVFAAQFAKLSPYANVEKITLAFAALVLVLALYGNREGTDGYAAVGGAKLRVFGEISDKDCSIHR
jgi:hypothetical protein